MTKYKQNLLKKQRKNINPKSLHNGDSFDLIKEKTQKIYKQKKIEKKIC